MKFARTQYLRCHHLARQANLSNQLAMDANPTATDGQTKKLTATAFHEAGHAVMAVSLGRTVHKVTVKPGGSQFGPAHAGRCLLDGRSKASKNALEDEVLILFAGMVAESHFTDAYCPNGAAEDLRMIRQLLCQRAGSPSQHERMHRRLLDKTEHILADEGHAKAVQAIANELEKRITVSGRAVRHLFQQSVQ